MRFSSPRQVLKYFYKRTNAFWDKSMLHKERVAYGKTRLKLYGALVLSMWYMYEFATPPPDVRFDIRWFFSSSFANYVQTKGAGGLDIADETMYKQFSFSKGKLLETALATPEGQAMGLSERIHS
ncbi:hypothetical protein niasHT_016861 [Heterodera trifolii]|uniref:Uncharacterized protein n=1 Tax=Heterodera trifolii TaxID=157864 RepID=A0ABD2KTM8_9BILA